MKMVSVSVIRGSPRGMISAGPCSSQGKQTFKMILDTYISASDRQLHEMAQQSSCCCYGVGPDGPESSVGLHVLLDGL
jgi:hypothetical protein